ncbi:MAG: MaoC/PaaZ C-terminal domain-containing protein [Persicimonas sp.]
MGTLEDSVGKSGERSGKGLNREMLGQTYELPAREVEADEMIAFAEAIEDDNPLHVDTSREGGIIATPLFPQRLLHRAMEEALTDERLEADLLRLVHGEQDMRFYRPLEPGDVCAARAEIADIEEKSSGELLTVRMWLDCDGEVVSEATAGLFIRAPKGASSQPTKSTSANKKASPSAGADKKIVYEESQGVGPDKPARYADASGDRNPIHTDPAVAKAAGLPDVILHGMCTMAFAANAIVDGICDGESPRLERIKVRFSRPVFPGQTVTTRIWEEAEEAGVLRLSFESVNDEEQAVLTHGLAEVGSGA